MSRYGSGVEQPPTPPQGPPPPPPSVPAVAQKPEEVVLTIGDILVSPSWVVTPNGTAPLAGSQWTVLDNTRVEKYLSGWTVFWAIFLAFFFLVGLLLLFFRKERIVGYVHVTVVSGHVMHTTQLPVAHPIDVDRARAIVRRAQVMAAAARR